LNLDRLGFFRGNKQGCSAKKKGVRTHPKNSHFKTASNSLAKREKAWERHSHALFSHYIPGTISPPKPSRGDGTGLGHGHCVLTSMFKTNRMLLWWTLDSTATTRN